jgi:microcystin-dependent protein
MNSRSNKIGKMPRLTSMLGTATLIGGLALSIGSPAQAQTDVEREFSNRIKKLEQRLQRNEARLAATAKNNVLIGTIMPYGGDSSREELAENGWLPCDGRRLYVKAETKPLFDVIGHAFGGDKAGTYFHLPDLRGRFVRGVDAETGRDPDAKNREASNPGGDTGDKVGSVQEDALKAHMHATDGKGDYLIWHGKSPKTDAKVSKNPVSIGGSETRPKNIYVNWIIKAKSVK